MPLRVSDLFDIDYGQSLSLNKLKQVAAGEGVAFVSRTARNNGVSAWVEPVPGVDPLPPGLLTVSLRSRNYALATFVQPRPFYCGYHVFVLRPKRDMTLPEKLWWAQAIEANRYRYNFGRQANRSLANLELPETVPDWVAEVRLPSFTADPTIRQTQALDTDHWLPYRLDSLFDVTRGRTVLKREMRPGNTPYVSASSLNNGVSAWLDLPPDHPGGRLTIASNGAVGEVFYQPLPFIASADVTILQPKANVPGPACLFVCTVIYAEKYRWNYGRKWHAGRIKESVIRLPATATGHPDWFRMERYILALPLARVVPWSDDQPATGDTVALTA